MSTSDDGRFVISDSNHAAFIVIVGVVGVSWTMLIAVIRITIKFHKKSPLNTEDLLLLTGTVSTLESNHLSGL